eukprot:7357161-Pyramimonas_sp.AAC.1
MAAGREQAICLCASSTLRRAMMPSAAWQGFRGLLRAPPSEEAPHSLQPSCSSRAPGRPRRPPGPPPGFHASRGGPPRPPRCLQDNSRPPQDTQDGPNTAHKASWNSQGRI